ncbi:hypothetical protein DE146DRAFT_636983 [Phaeosphaeria sp. MPI-PUGE-AT-0046c]|nr:hypothetical protein DE146DRAFT_636983 [Phaeosphaeria sp. MPI-PUGE-AT-0046c]
MDRRPSFLAASQHPPTTRSRRRSADDRLLRTDARTSKTAASKHLPLGETQDQPIVIPSDDENDVINGTKATTDKQQNSQNKLRTRQRADQLLSLRSKSESQLLHPPSTPERIRPPIPRMAQTDPEVERLSKRVDAAAQTTPSRIILQCLCGMVYVERASYNKHLEKCVQYEDSNAEVPDTDRVATLTRTEPSMTLQDQVANHETSSPVRSTQKEDKERSVPASPVAAAATIDTNADGLAISKQVSAIDIHSSLLRKACAVYTKKPREASVYLLRSPDLPGLVKVGMTGSIANRKTQFKSRCGQIMDTIDNVDLLHGVERIEALVKLDLRDLNEPWQCQKCGREHQEWFRIDEEQAKRILQMWVDWLEQKPYEVDGSIKPLWRHLLWKGRRPSPRFSNGDHKARRAHWDYALGLPTQDEIEGFVLMQPEIQRQQAPLNQGQVATKDVPQRLTVPVTPIHSTTYHITDNSVNRYRNCQSSSRAVVSNIGQLRL